MPRKASRTGRKKGNEPTLKNEGWGTHNNWKRRGCSKAMPRKASRTGRKKGNEPTLKNEGWGTHKNWKRRGYSKATPRKPSRTGRKKGNEPTLKNDPSEFPSILRASPSICLLRLSGQAGQEGGAPAKVEQRKDPPLKTKGGAPVKTGRVAVTRRRRESCKRKFREIEEIEKTARLF
jgi:hypothetical protein